MKTDTEKLIEDLEHPKCTTVHVTSHDGALLKVDKNHLIEHLKLKTAIYVKKDGSLTLTYYKSKADRPDGRSGYSIWIN